MITHNDKQKEERAYCQWCGTNRKMNHSRCEQKHGEFVKKHMQQEGWVFSHDNVMAVRVRPEKKWYQFWK
jgi:hypothetical protein